MYAVVRRYANAKALGDALMARQDEVNELLGSIPGFVTWYAVRTIDGLATVTVCQDKEGTTESTRRAAEWIKTNLPDANIAPPEISEGDVIMDVAPGA